MRYWVGFLVLVSCSETVTLDAGAPSDAAVSDERTIVELDAFSDAGVSDVTADDARLVDSGADDSGITDLGVPDFGRDMDAGDAAVVDAGADSGVADTGPTDASVADAGAADSGLPETCNVAGLSSTCVDVTACNANTFYGECSGGLRNVCCFAETTCSVSGAPGLCLDVANCAGTSTPGRCPGAANIQCCTQAGTACDETAAPTPNQGIVEQNYTLACPDGMVLAGTFCIDRFEASLVELNGAHWSPFVNPGSTPVRAVSLPYAIPQAYISGNQAAAACSQAGKRLCSDTEWLAACQGQAGLTYPYGNTRVDGQCNDARRVHPAIEYFGRNDQSVFNMLDNRCINQIPDSVALTGQHAGCESPVGAFDMMGNLHEWTSASGGTFRGGFYTDTRNNGNGCLYDTTAHNRSYWDYSTGFRCCADPL